MVDRLLTSGLLLGALAFSSSASASPWDIDMVDAYFYRGYEWKMAQVPEGAVSQNRYHPNFDRMTPEGKALTNPYPADDASIAKGKRAFDNVCTACHGKDGLGGAPVTDNNPAEKKLRYPVAAPNLSGAGSVVPQRTDGHLYLTIRNGSAIMASYKQALDDDEMWAIVAYLRSLNTSTNP